MAQRRRSVHPDQLAFDLGEGGSPHPPESVPTSRDSVFFAVMPPPGIALAIERFGEGAKRRFELFGKLRPTKTLHSTLLGIGRYEKLSAELIDQVRLAASTIDMDRFVVAFDRLFSFRHDERRPLVLGGDEGVIGLHALRKALLAALGKQRLTVPAPPENTPHLTLLYDRKFVDEVLLDEPVTWTVRDFVLVRSWHGESRYTELGRWPLGGGR